MTQRKPPGRSWESWVEQQIRQAQAEGAFDNLEGAGKPLPDIDKPYDPEWWVKQLVRREQLSVMPPSLRILRRVEGELEKIWTLRSESEVRERVRALNVEIAKVNRSASAGPPSRLAPLDVDAVVDDWRRRAG